MNCYQIICEAINIAKLKKISKIIANKKVLGAGQKSQKAAHSIMNKAKLAGKKRDQFNKYLAMGRTISR